MLSKIDAVLPQRLRPELKAAGMEVLAFSHDPRTRRALSVARLGMKERRRMAAEYLDGKEAVTSRVLWPLGLFYWGGVWTLAATYALVRLVGLVVRLRVDAESETNGLDLSAHGERAYELNS